jgi:two-component system LytT family response regulator
MGSETGMRKIRVMIADDEPLAGENLELLVGRYGAAEIVANCRSGRSTIEALARTETDLLFLDIELGDMSGFEVLKRIDCEHPPVVVFVTAFDEHAVKAFEVNALDYLLKPIDDARFDQTMNRVEEYLRKHRLGDYRDRLMALLDEIDDGKEIGSRPGPPAEKPNRIAIRSTGKIEFVSCDDIDWIEAAGSYVEIHTPSRTYLLRGTMTSLEQQLDPCRFIRVHRSAIVNTGRIRELKPHRRGEYFITLNDGTRLKLSRGNRHKLDLLIAPAG